MQCIICYETKWILRTECHHHLCLNCLFDIKKDECPYCRQQLFKNFPKHLRSFLSINAMKKEKMDIYNNEQFPSLLSNRK
jgi:hypothetical protein